MTNVASRWLDICAIDSIPPRGCRVVRSPHGDIAEQTAFSHVRYVTAPDAGADALAAVTLRRRRDAFVAGITREHAQAIRPIGGGSVNLPAGA